MSSTKNKIVLKKLKDTDKVWHSDSTLVFKSLKDKVVIGRYFEKEIIPLDDLCLELCSKWKFKYDKDLVEEDDEEDEDEEVVENQDGGDEQESEKESEKEVQQEKDESEDDDVEVDLEVKVEKKDHESEEEVEDKSEEDEEKVESEQNKNEIKVQQDINYKKAYLTDITYDFSKKIYDYFDSVSQKYNQELLNLKNDITTKDKIHSELLKEHESVKEELKKLKTKFEGIKQLFSL